MAILDNVKEPCLSGRYYRVKEGETLQSIASKVGISIAELESLNQTIDLEKLQGGQLLCLPGENPCLSGVFWEVEEGDTFYKISLELGTTVEKLLELNPFVDPLNLQIGQVLCLP